MCRCEHVPTSKKKVVCFYFSHLRCFFSSKEDIFKDPSFKKMFLLKFDCQQS